MTTATDIQQLKDLIAAGNTATQKQIADLTTELRVGFAEVKGELKALDTKFEEKSKSLDQRITGIYYQRRYCNYFGWVHVWFF